MARVARIPEPGYSPATLPTLTWVRSCSASPTGFTSTVLLFSITLSARAQTPAQASPDVVTQVQASLARLASETYVKPAPELVKLITAPRQPTSLGQQSPDRRYFLREESEGMPSVNDFGKPHYYFAGLQVDPAANRARALSTRGAARLRLVDAATGTSRAITIPPGARVTAPVWSPNGKQIAFIANFATGSHAYVADVATGAARQITPASSPLLATLVTSLDWTAGGAALAVVLVPANRGPEPVKPAVARGPLVRLWTDSAKSPQRNFASLLDEPFDQTLMEYYTTGQLAVIDLKTRAVRRIGSPAMFLNVDPSPDGKYFRVTTMRKPFSYVVQYQNFAQTDEIWDGSGGVLAEVNKRPLREAPDTSDTPGPQPGRREQARARLDAVRGRSLLSRGDAGGRTKRRS